MEDWILNTSNPLINLFGEHAPEECNVGIARDIAAKETDNRIIITTDADIRKVLSYPLRKN